MRPISIILPVYNGIKYLSLAVESVLQQTFTDFEFLIIEDCSTDSCWEYLSSLKDDRVKLFKNEVNKGLFYNLNFLINRAEAPLIKLWSQDDIMYPDCIAKTVSFHQQNPGIGFSYSGRNYIDENGATMLDDTEDMTPAIVSKDLHTRIAFYTGSIAGNIANVTLTKEALDKVGLFNERMKISGDFDMWVRIAKYYPIGYISEPLIQLRNHEGQLSRQEKYYIHHLEEDVQIYKYLLSYISEVQQKKGKNLLRHRKLLFYYTLMLQALFKGQIKVAHRFFKVLNEFDNIMILSWFFVGNRILKMKIPSLYSRQEETFYKQHASKTALPLTNAAEPAFVSVLMTAYNREKYIGEAIESVLRSAYTNFELIIVDDASTDNTTAIASAYAEKDQRIKIFINEKNLGDYPNRNKAASLAKGKYIKFVDSDDMIYPDTLKIMVEGMEKFPEAAMGISQVTNKEKEFFPEMIGPEAAYKQHFYGEGILRYGPTGTIINRDIFNKMGGFNPKRYTSDSEFWLKLSAIYPIVKLQPDLVYWRIHPEQEFYYGNTSFSYIENAYKIYVKALRSKNCPLQQDDIKKIIRRLNWKQARDILSIAFRKRNLKEALRIYQGSDINFATLLSGLLSYRVMRSRF